MNICYVRASSIFSDSRAQKEIKALLKNGYRVLLFAWNRNDVEIADKIMDVFSHHHRLKLFLFERKTVSGKGFKSLNNFLGFFRWLRKAMIKNILEIDIIHSCDFDTGYISSKVARRFKKKFVYDIYDYFSDNRNISSNIIRKIFSLLENMVIASADLVIICTEERVEQIKNSNYKKVIVVHNTPEIICVPIAKEVYDYAYCGGFSENRLLSEILSQYNNNYVFAFAGHGKYFELINEMDKSNSNFNYFGEVLYDVVLEIESKSMILSAIYNPALRNHRLAAPNKFYEALALGKPIIVCKGTGIDKIVEENNIGIVINYSSFEFYAALNKLLNDSELRSVMSNNAKKLYEKNYSWKVMEEKLISAYKEL